MAVGDIKLAYAASAALTITLASLATSSTAIAGRESTAVNNSATKYSDVLLGGFITTGTTPTVDKRIEVWAYGSLNDTPLYPDTIVGTNNARALTSTNVKRSALRLVTAMMVDATSNRAYYFGPTSMAELFGGSLPKYWGVFVVHDTGVALNATAGNHVISYTPVYSTVE